MKRLYWTLILWLWHGHALREAWLLAGEWAFRL